MNDEKRLLERIFQNRVNDANSVVRVLHSLGRLNELNRTAVGAVANMKELIDQIVKLGGTVTADGNILWLR